MFGFKRIGRTVHLGRWLLEWGEPVEQLSWTRDEDGSPVSHRKIEFLPNVYVALNDQERDAKIEYLGALNPTVTPIDQTGKEWFDGLQFDDYDAAREIYKGTEQEYYEWLAKN
ncbi:MAG: hypothetical protein FWE04_04380 [Oscillospiraceae bacterium]|nr:hypothetical protein [Oscillospiraceae bacterium]